MKPRLEISVKAPRGHGATTMLQTSTGTEVSLGVGEGRPMAILTSQIIGLYIVGGEDFYKQVFLSRIFLVRKK